MVPGSSVSSTYENGIPRNRRIDTCGIRCTGERLLLSIIYNRNAVGHEVVDHGITGTK